MVNVKIFKSYGLDFFSTNIQVSTHSEEDSQLLQLVFITSLCIELQAFACTITLTCWIDDRKQRRVMGIFEKKIENKSLSRIAQE